MTKKNNDKHNDQIDLFNENLLPEEPQRRENSKFYRKKLKFIDLFCGIGGFRIALEKKGMECVFSSDIDKHVQDVYYKNFGERPAGDITQVNEKNIPKHDILCAGFPCQTFSISGSRKGMYDSRGKLFYEIIRIAKYHQPIILLLENVRNILTIDHGSVIRTIENELNTIGYKVNKYLLDSSLYGIPQSRKRVYFVCIKREYAQDIVSDYPKNLMHQIHLDDVLESNPDSSLFINRDDIIINKHERDIEKDLKPIKVGIINKGGQGERIYSPKGHSITLSAFGGGIGAKTGLYHTNLGVRRLSINECKKVMGFPISHITTEGSQSYQQLGNAVIPTMIEQVWNNIRGI